MSLFNYPISPASFQANTKFRFHEPPPPWVGPLRPRRLDSIESALAGGVAADAAMNGGASRIVIAPKAAPLRIAVTGRKTYVTGSQFGAKCGRPAQWEEIYEDAVIRQSEIDPGVVSFRCQAVEFTTSRTGRNRRYTADLVRYLADGRLQVIEVKSSLKAIRDPQYREKLQEVHDICASVGWEFLIVEGLKLHEKNVFNCNIDILVDRLFTVMPESLAALARMRISKSGGSAPFDLVAELCGEGRVGVDRVCCLISRGNLQADLRYQIDHDSLVSLPEEL